jgi:hypothetical protein
MQEATGWARLGDQRPAEEALLRGAEALERRSEPEHPDHHFEFDTDKFAYYAGTTYAGLGMAKNTEKYALQVMEGNKDPRRPNFWPGRVRGAHLDRLGRPRRQARYRSWLMRLVAAMSK